MGIAVGRRMRLQVVVRVRREESDGGRMVVRYSRRSAVVAAGEMEKETVGGRERPGKVLSRTLALAGWSIVVDGVLNVYSARLVLRAILGVRRWQYEQSIS
jgi:hypothetical protein